VKTSFWFILLKSLPSRKRMLQRKTGNKNLAGTDRVRFKIFLRASFLQHRSEETEESTEADQSEEVLRKNPPRQEGVCTEEVQGSKHGE